MKPSHDSPRSTYSLLSLFITVDCPNEIFSIDNIKSWTIEDIIYYDFIEIKYSDYNLDFKDNSLGNESFAFDFYLS